MKDNPNIRQAMHRAMAIPQERFILAQGVLLFNKLITVLHSIGNSAENQAKLARTLIKWLPIKEMLGEDVANHRTHRHRHRQHQNTRLIQSSLPPISGILYGFLYKNAESLCILKTNREKQEKMNKRDYKMWGSSQHRLSKHS